MRDFGNSWLGRGLGLALIILALFVGLSLIFKACSDASSACAQAGGSWDGGSASCEVGK